MRMIKVAVAMLIRDRTRRLHVCTKANAEYDWDGTLYSCESICNCVNRTGLFMRNASSWGYGGFLRRHNG